MRREVQTTCYPSMTQNLTGAGTLNLARRAHKLRPDFKTYPVRRFFWGLEIQSCWQNANADIENSGN